MSDLPPEEKERLVGLLRSRLSECGWMEQVKMSCKKVVQERGTNISVKDLVTEVTPGARASVPDSVKKELLQKIKNHFMEEAGLL